MNHTPQPKFSAMSFLFPLVLAANLILFLFLLAQTRNHQELKVANDRELANRQELEAALPGLQAEVSRLSKERQALEDAILGAQRTIAAAQEIDARTGQLRQTEKTLSASVQAQATTNVDQAEALATIVRKTAVANAQWKESNDRLSGLSQQLALAQTEASRLQREKQALETEIKSLNGAKAEAEDISSRIERLRREAKSLADSNQAQNYATAQQTAVLSEIIQTNAAASAELRKVKGSLEALNAEIGTRGKQIEGLTKQQADWTEIARVRAERAELLGRNDVTREELKSAAKKLQDMERQRDQLSALITALEKKRADTERAAPPVRESNEKK